MQEVIWRIQQVTTTQTPTPQSSSATTPVTQSPSLTIVKTRTSGPSPVTAAGQVLGYTIVVPIRAIELRPRKYDRFIAKWISGHTNRTYGEISTNGQLNVGETWTYTINYTVSQANI